MTEYIVSNIISTSLNSPQRIINKVYDKIGFNIIQDEELRHLVVSRICSPMSKKATVDYLRRHFKEEVSLYLVRQQVKPGMTGWAQVNGLRGDTSIEDRVQYDIWYIENWSLGLDIQILLRTAFGGMVNREELTPKRKEEKADG